MPDVVTFTTDPYRIVEISTGGDNSLDWIEIYSEWKEWAKANPGHPQAFRYVGADPITDIQNLGTTFFLLSPWKFRPAEHDHRLLLNGNIWTDPPGGRITAPTAGGYTVEVAMFVSNLVDAAVARLDLAQLQEAVFIDVDNGVPGTAEGIGTPTNPVDNIADAFTIADRENLRAFSIQGAVTLDRAVSNWRFVGTIGPTCGSLGFGGYTATLCSFESLSLTGNAGSSHIEAFKCALTDLLSCSGSFEECALDSLFTPGNTSTTTLAYCRSNMPGDDNPVIDLGDLTADNLQVRAYSGGLVLKNIDVPTQKVSVDLVAGHLVLDSTCEAGQVVLRGVGKFTDLSTGSLVVDKLGFIGMPHDDPHSMLWMYEIMRRAMLEAYAANI